MSRQFFRLHAGRANALVPGLAGTLVRRFGFRRAAIANRRSAKDCHPYSPPERSTEWPPPWLSPDFRACAAVCAPLVMAWLRFMRCAQAGGPDSEGPDGVCGGGAPLEASPPPTVPIVEEPPVLAKLDRAPEAKLCCMAPAARAAERLTGSGGCRACCPAHAAETGRDARRAGPVGRGEAVGGGCPARHRGAAGARRRLCPRPRPSLLSRPSPAHQRRP